MKHGECVKLFSHISVLILFFLKEGNKSTIYKQNKNGQTELTNSILHYFDSVKMVKNKLQLARSHK